MTAVRVKWRPPKGLRGEHGVAPALPLRLPMNRHVIFLIAAAVSGFAGQSGAQSWNARALTIGGSLPARVSWSRTDVVLAGAFTAGLLLDAGQTRGLARDGWEGFREGNPLLGPTPSVGRINAYTAVAGLAVLGAAAIVPPRVRPWVLGAALAVQMVTVSRSVAKGIPIRLP